MTQSTLASCGDYLHTAQGPAAMGQKSGSSIDASTQNATLPSRRLPCHGPECNRGPMPFTPVVPNHNSPDYHERCFLELMAFRMRDDLASGLLWEDALLLPDPPRSRIDYPPEA